MKTKAVAARKLLASATLSTAIISWIATAQGLNTYVFEHYWQAAIISGAIQGTLFAFSVNAIPLMKRLRWIGKIAMGAMWIVLLMASSIFSYVYISKIAYSDRLLEEDANRILAKECLEIYFELDDILDLEKIEIERGMEGYITILGGSETGVSLNEDSKSRIDETVTKLKDFNEKGIKNVPANIVIMLEQIKDGMYASNDISTLEGLIENEKLEVDGLESTLNTEIVNIQTDIDNKNARLETFTNVNSNAYLELVAEVRKTEEKRDEIFEKIKELNGYVNELDDIKVLIGFIEKTLEKSLYDETLVLRACMNEEELNPDEIQKSAENIYNILLKNNISASDGRLVGYRDFRNYISEYKRVMESKNKIINGLETVYEYSNNSEEMTKHWRDKLNELQDIAKDIPQKYYDEYSGKVTKSKIVEMASTLDRLYLSDLNEFELAWTLLINEVHTYKTLLRFSVIVAIGIDLFSFGAGMLLYFIKQVETEEGL